MDQGPGPGSGVREDTATVVAVETGLTFAVVEAYDAVRAADNQVETTVIVEIAPGDCAADYTCETGLDVLVFPWALRRRCGRCR